jgi:pyruvate/2-oxoglutarate dehydrogenase complex dihydrolipoamide dehydrogenase (E3) component
LSIEAPESPGSLVVLGGVAIGSELPQTFARFGSVVAVVEGADRLLPTEEPDVSAVIEAVLKAEGLKSAHRVPRRRGVLVAACLLHRPDPVE